MKLIEWLKDGGGIYLGRDSSGEDMYSVCNGVIFSMTVVAVAGIIVLVWLVKELITFCC